MEPTKTERGEMLGTVVIVSIIIAFSLFVISIHFIDAIYTFVKERGPALEAASAVIFLGLYVFLWLGYRLWRKSSKKRQMLETIMAALEPDVLLVVDVDRTIRFCAGAAPRMFGHSVDDLVGKKTDILYGDRREDPSKQHEIHEILEKEGYHIGYAAGTKKDGGDIALEVLTSKLAGRAGAVVLLRDISARKQAEDALRESEEKHRLLFEESLEALSLVRGSKIIDANPAWLRLHGYGSKEEVIGMDVVNVVHPDDRDLFEQRRKEWDGKKGRFFEVRDVRKNGTVAHVQLYSSTITIEGEETILTTVRNVTERRRAERALRTSHTLLEMANRHADMESMLKDFVTEIKRFMDCAAVGFRILEADGNAPYRAHEGFTKEFYESENVISAASDACLCTTVMKGETDASRPFFTDRGSFYTNNAPEFFQALSEDEKAQMRSACGASGFLSMALVPIRAGDETLGVIHVADTKVDAVPLWKLEILEDAALELGMAIKRVRP